MAITRRDFIETVFYSGGVMLMTACSRAEQPVEHEDDWLPAYMKLEEEGKFAARIEQANSAFEACDLCPRRCGANRARGFTGYCRAPDKPVVFSHHPHFGEETPLVGRQGSGTIFFSNCNLRCVFCQNYPIAHEGRGQEVSIDALAEMMLHLQRTGCRNINLVTPTHVMPNILSATRVAMQKGLRIPLCYNTGGYERKVNIELLDGIVDIYLPDLKYMDGKQASRYSSDAEDYPEMAQSAIIEMNRQVGALVTDSQGNALRGLMVRHLVMPNRIAGTKEFITWVAENLSKDTYVNIMSQYRVEHRAFEYPPIARAITADEFLEAMDWAEEAGLTNLDDRSVAQRGVFMRRRS